MQDAILVISPENYNVLFSNLMAKKMFNNDQFNQQSEINAKVMSEYIFHTAQKHSQLSSLQFS